MVRSCDSRCSVSHALCSARAACSANCSTIAITHRRMVGWPVPRSTTTAPSPCRRPRSNGTTSTFLASGRSDASRGSVSGSMARKSWLARSSQARDTDRSIPTAMSVGDSSPVHARRSRSSCGDARTTPRSNPKVEAQLFEKHAGDVRGLGVGVHASHHRGEPREVVLLSAELALARGREQRGPESEHPQPGDGECCRVLDVRLDARRHPSVQDTGSSGLDHQEQQQRVPQGELQPGPVGTEQSHAHDVDVRQELDRLRGPSRLSDHGGQVEAVHQQRPLQHRDRGSSASADDRGDEERESEEGRGRGRDRDRRLAIGCQNDERHHAREPEAKAGEVARALGDREQLGRVGRQTSMRGSEDHANSTMSDSTGASASRGSFRSKRSWIATNPTASPKSVSTIAKLRATPSRTRVEPIPGCGDGPPYVRRCRCRRRRRARAGRGMRAAAAGDRVRWVPLRVEEPGSRCRLIAGRADDGSHRRHLRRWGRAGRPRRHRGDPSRDRARHPSPRRPHRSPGPTVSSPGRVDGADRVVHAALAGSDGFFPEAHEVLRRAGCVGERDARGSDRQGGQCDHGRSIGSTSSRGTTSGGRGARRSNVSRLIIGIGAPSLDSAEPHIPRSWLSSESGTGSPTIGPWTSSTPRFRSSCSCSSETTPGAINLSSHVRCTGDQGGDDGVAREASAQAIERAFRPAGPVPAKAR